MRKITEKDKKILIGASVLIAIFIVYSVVSPKLKDWKQTNTDLAKAQKMFDSVAGKNAAQQKKYAEVAAEVPFFEMPQKVGMQKLAFREKLSQQLKSCGIAVTKLDLMPMPKKRSGLNTLRIKCQGKTDFKKVSDLLAKLYENPYFVAVEELKLEFDAKNRSKVELNLVVSTFVKN